MWDPRAHPDFRTVADIGRTDTRVLYFQGATYTTNEFIDPSIGIRR